jgi:nucleotide-binding universal stress UspA family protein
MASDQPEQKPIIIGYDGSPASDLAVNAAAELFKSRKALVVTVWEPQQAWAAVVPSGAITPVPVDIRLGIELEKELYEGAQRNAQRGADLAAQGGLDAAPSVVADSISVGETLARLAEKHDAAAIVVGSHGHAALTEALFGSTTRDVLKKAPCPAVVVRGPRH